MKGRASGRKGYGWTPDIPDHRDHHFAPSTDLQRRLPESVDLRPLCPPVYDQKALNSCTAQAIAGAIQFCLMKQGVADFVPSRLFIYYNERAARNVVCADCGSTPREGIKAVAAKGDCPETLWPYHPRKFAAKPPRICFSTARKYKALSYERIKRDLAHFKCCLASGYPFVLGMTVHDSFQSFERNAVRYSGHLQLPGKGDGVEGGHAVLAVGYDDDNGWFMVRNSFGEDWGMKGYFTVPYEYLMREDLSADFWKIDVVS